MTDVDAETARLSIRAIGGIGLRLPKMATPIVKQLTTFINMNQDYITNETIVMFKGTFTLMFSVPNSSVRVCTSTVITCCRSPTC